MLVEYDVVVRPLIAQRNALAACLRDIIRTGPESLLFVDVMEHARALLARYDNLRVIK